MPLTQANRFVAIDTPLGADALVVRSVSCTEQISRLFQIELDLISTDAEIPFEDIADIVVEKAGRRNPPSLYIHYVMRDDERIPWAESYDGAKEETLECARAAREVLELPPLIMDPG